MHIMLDIAEEFGFKIRSFHHALEAYKLRELVGEVGFFFIHLGRLVGSQMEAMTGFHTMPHPERSWR